jgi:hypothetical protein
MKTAATFLSLSAHNVDLNIPNQQQLTKLLSAQFICPEAKLG